VKRLGDIPESMSDGAAAAFYDAHEITTEALAEMPDVSHEFEGRVVRTRPISIRFPERMLAELKSLAADRGVAYQALIKVWLDERLRKERKERKSDRRSA